MPDDISAWKFGNARRICYLCGMANEKGFRIELSSRFDGWWRYNAALMCGCFDAEGRRTGFAKASSQVAEVGANLAQKPADVPADRRVVLLAEPCDHLILYLYVIPHTLPGEDDIEAVAPFDVEVKIFYAGRRLSSERRRINQWSGASVELRVDAPQQQ